MKLYFRGNFDGDYSQLPSRDPAPHHVKFKEADNLEDFALKINILALGISGLALLLFSLHTGSLKNFHLNGSILALLTLVPHEFLHALCFRGPVYFYMKLTRGILFVTGTETMTRGRAILTNLLPNLVFAFLPLALFLLNRDLHLLGSMAVFTLGMGAGDYYNVFNILSQMPKGAYTYMSGTSSYWFK
ncbi:MAG: DUF3267 domain-containing protein [Tissierellia bacterium]|nr:DUF3267 domain-containing protein [Tissierellia bacterium]